MITLEDARTLAAREVAALESRIRVPLVIDDTATRDDGWCWLFFYNSRAYLETGNFSDALAGNGPLVVEKATGTVHTLLVARPIESQLAEIRRRLHD